MVGKITIRLGAEAGGGGGGGGGGRGCKRTSRHTYRHAVSNPCVSNSLLIKLGVTSVRKPFVLRHLKRRIILSIKLHAYTRYKGCVSTFPERSD